MPGRTVVFHGSRSARPERARRLHAPLAGIRFADILALPPRPRQFWPAGGPGVPENFHDHFLDWKALRRRVIRLPSFVSSQPFIPRLQFRVTVTLLRPSGRSRSRRQRLMWLMRPSDPERHFTFSRKARRCSNSRRAAVWLALARNDAGATGGGCHRRGVDPPCPTTRRCPRMPT